MKLAHKLSYASLLAAALVLIAAPLAFAWPDQPPDSAWISGPGLAGEVAITDPAVLSALRLGGIEDFGAFVPEPASQVRYVIHRLFYDNSFDFGVLTYVPADGGYVRFDDGADLSGDHTVYNGHWFRVTAQGQQALTGLLARVAPAASGEAVAISNRSLVWVWMAILAAGLALAAGLGLSRRRGQPAGS